MRAGSSRRRGCRSTGRDSTRSLIGPTDAVTAADRAILTRAIARDLAASHGMRAGLRPTGAADAVGNGVHIHLSLWDRAGRPVTLDAETREPSTHTQRFVAGIRARRRTRGLDGPERGLEHPSRTRPVERGGGVLRADEPRGVRPALPGHDPGDARTLEMANVEYRACDATANPWLALAALIRAGIDGLQRELPAPALVEGDLETIGPADRDRLEIVDLPRDLEAAQAALEEDDVARTWFAAQLLETHLSIRRTEARDLAAMTPDERCRRYADVI